MGGRKDKEGGGKGEGRGVAVLVYPKDLEGSIQEMGRLNRPFSSRHQRHIITLEARLGLTRRTKQNEKRTECLSMWISLCLQYLMFKGITMQGQR